jgi:hypothetical protein
MTTSVLYNGKQVQLLAGYADALTGALHIVQFRETRADLGETARLRVIDWNKSAPRGAELILPEAGHILEMLAEFWFAWRSGSTLSAQAMTQDHPQSIEIPAGEVIIDRPVVGLGKELHVYAWRGRQLVKHRFSTTATPVTENIVELDYDVVHSRTASVPGDDNDTTLIAATGVKDGRILASALYVRGARALRVDSAFDGAHKIMAAQRIGAHAGTKMRPAIALLAENESGGYALLETVFEYAKRESAWSDTVYESLAPRQLKSAAVCYYKTQDSPEPFAVAVNTKDEVIQPRLTRFQIVRAGAGDGYSFPIMTTFASRYEVLGSGDSAQLLTF